MIELMHHLGFVKRDIPVLADPIETIPGETRRAQLCGSAEPHRILGHDGGELERQVVL